MRPAIVFLALLLTLLGLSACSLDSLPFVGTTPIPPNQVTYDGAIALSIKNGQTLAGTNLAYQGKSVDGRALLLIGNEQAAKSTADSVNYTGEPVPGSLVKLNLRVGMYDQNTVNLVGTVHIEIKDIQPTAGDPAPESLAAFGIPVQYTVAKSQNIPGTTVQYLGQSRDGAQFSNLGQFPYRQQFDSVVWSGRLRDKVSVKLDLRLITFSEDSATLLGTAQVLFEK